MMLNSAPASPDHFLLLLQATATPEATKERVLQIKAAEARLGDLTALRSALDADRQAHEDAVASWRAEKASEEKRIAAAWAEIAEARAELHVKTEQHRRNTEAHKALVAVFETDKAKHANALNELARVKAALSA